ncbi:MULTISPECIES: hypothetical protein [Streptomyces]|uniref:Uncharacterized protein n=1 Tax=Streptomyces violarus TaxID=67380 RepID=A0A7W4ZYQ2_9ACTN|nr:MULTISPECIES: hypothetical protein [Streptomyces]MBB3080967.1 hypothetical protein [Streptomyces violarus]MCT9145126.1 hypothetical protein [Streptomyces violarus]WRU02914.1 hypothetical protein VJ737_36820 [Streptomyces sp. CGMCC 4.1772]GHD29133.1 hypothetical protein GCM10010313_70600 [Streptomyces violarus]
MAEAPNGDVEFRNAIMDVFLKYPEAQRRYALASLELENEMDIDFETQVGYSRIDGNKIITEFRDRDTSVKARICLKWNFDYSRCLHWRQAEM